MRKASTINLPETDRRSLIVIVTDRNSPQKHVWRAQIVLLSAEGCGTMELTRRTGTSKTSVWRWQALFLAEGVPGLLRDKTRPSRIPPLGTEVEARVVTATQTPPPGDTTHWTAPSMARHIGIVSVRCSASGASTASSHTRSVSSSCPMTPGLPPSCPRSSDSTSTGHPPLSNPSARLQVTR